MFGELVGGAGCVEGHERDRMSPGRPQSFRYQRLQWTIAAQQNEGEWLKTRRNKGWNVSCQNGSLQRNSGLDNGSSDFSLNTMYL